MRACGRKRSEEKPRGIERVSGWPERVVIKDVGELACSQHPRRIPVTESADAHSGAVPEEI